MKKYFEKKLRSNILDLTIVIPCYNESTHIEESVKELLFCMKNCCFEYEILFIDDASTDDTYNKLNKLKD